MNNIETFLKSNILPELDKGRANFDRLHTEAVVHWLNKVIDNSPVLDVDRQVLLIAAYAHDLGYAGLFRDGNQPQYDEVANAKARHMQLGAEKLSQILNESVFDALSEEQKRRCIHLVSVHDKLDELRSLDELVLMEADTFGGLDVDFVKPTFDFASNKKYIEEVKAKRVPKFITEFSKSNIGTQIQKRLDFYSVNRIF